MNFFLEIHYECFPIQEEPELRVSPCLKLPQPSPFPGEKGICPKYCAIDGGVFFEDGTRR
jgi:hypothetical protein